MLLKALADMVAAMYARKSIDQAGVADEQRPVTRQIDHARSYAKARGWTVVDEHIWFLDVALIRTPQPCVEVIDFGAPAWQAVVPLGERTEACAVRYSPAPPTTACSTVMRFQPPPSAPRAECMECPTCRADDARLAYANPRRRVFACPRCQSLWQALTHTSPAERPYEKAGRASVRDAYA
jgi:hypothetical protein